MDDSFISSNAGSVTGLEDTYASSHFGSQTGSESGLLSERISSVGSFDDVESTLQDRPLSETDDESTYKGYQPEPMKEVSSWSGQLKEYLCFVELQVERNCFEGRVVASRYSSRFKPVKCVHLYRFYNMWYSLGSPDLLPSVFTPQDVNANQLCGIPSEVPLLTWYYVVGRKCWSTRRLPDRIIRNNLGGGEMIRGKRCTEIEEELN